MTDYSELVKEARETAHYADEYAGERELWTRAADALEAQAKEIAELEARDDAALRAATILAVSLAEKHWPENMDWRPLDETAGVISQINNMCAGLDARIAELEAALKNWDALIRHQYTGSREAISDMTVCAQETAKLLYGPAPWPSFTANAALNGEKTDE